MTKYLVHTVQMDLNKVLKSSLRIPTDAKALTGITAICNETNEYYKVNLKTIAEASVCLNTEISAFFRVFVPLPTGKVRFKQAFNNLYLPVKTGDMLEIMTTDRLHTKYYCQDAFSNGFSNAFGSQPKFCPDATYSVTLLIRYTTEEVKL